MADVVHDRLLQAIDWNPTQINSLTASTPAAIRTPIHFSSDRECLERIWPPGSPSPEDLRIGWIANSLDLGTMRLSENLRGEIESKSDLEIVGEAEELEFDGREPGGNIGSSIGASLSALATGNSREKHAAATAGSSRANSLY